MRKGIKYKGYFASVEYDADDDIFVGNVAGVRDVLCFHGKSVDELKKNFKCCIDDYLEICKKHGREPDKCYSGIFNVRISPETHRRAAMMAAKRNMKLNQLVNAAIEHELEGTGFAP